jgi:hypothetical protein
MRLGTWWRLGCGPCEFGLFPLPLFSDQISWIWENRSANIEAGRDLANIGEETQRCEEIWNKFDTMVEDGKINAIVRMLVIFLERCLTCLIGKVWENLLSHLQRPTM